MYTGGDTGGGRCSANEPFSFDTPDAPVLTLPRHRPPLRCHGPSTCAPTPPLSLPLSLQVRRAPLLSLPVRRDDDTQTHDDDDAGNDGGDENCGGAPADDNEAS